MSNVVQMPYKRLTGSQKSRNNLTLRPYSRLRVFEREFAMTMKMVITPLTFASLAVLLVYTEPHIPCVLMILAKFAGHISL
jgi:hypothetical protein